MQDVQVLLKEEAQNVLMMAQIFLVAGAILPWLLLVLRPKAITRAWCYLAPLWCLILASSQYKDVNLFFLPATIGLIVLWAIGLSGLLTQPVAQIAQSTIFGIFGVGNAVSAILLRSLPRETLASDPYAISGFRLLEVPAYAFLLLCFFLFHLYITGARSRSPHHDSLGQ